MIHISVSPDIEKDPWLKDSTGVDLGTITRIGRLPNGMKSGASTVTVKIEFGDGSFVLGQTSLKLWNNATKVMNAAEESEE